MILSGSGSSSDIRASYAAASGPSALSTEFCNCDSFKSVLGELILYNGV